MARPQHHLLAFSKQENSTIVGHPLPGTSSSSTGSMALVCSRISYSNSRISPNDDNYIPWNLKLNLNNSPSILNFLDTQMTWST